MSPNSIALISLGASIFATIISIFAASYSRRQAKAAETQVAIAQAQLEASQVHAARVTLRDARQLRAGATEYHFSDGTLITAHRALGGRVAYVAYGNQIRGNDPTYAPYIAIIEGHGK